MEQHCLFGHILDVCTSLTSPHGHWPCGSLCLPFFALLLTECRLAMN